MTDLNQSKVQIWFCGSLILVAGIFAYSNSFHGVFLFDDRESILANLTVRPGTSWRDWIHPPANGVTVSGRLAVNVSIALNWLWSGIQPWSYHFFNLSVHLLGGFALFGIMRRTLERIGSLRSAATGLAGVTALWWTVHPLQTESVTYVVQRAESMMALCYLGALLFFLRFAAACEAGRGRAGTAWAVGSVIVCGLGMVCKEVMVSAPVIIFLYDRTFLSGSFALAWRQRRGYWCALGCTWIALAFALAQSGNRGGTTGFASGLRAWQYWLTQGPVILRYLRQMLWPFPLVLDYGFEKHWIAHPATAVPAAAIVASMAMLSLILLRRAPRWGFPAFWFFCILAPTSFIPGHRQTAAEHRMYLALAPLLALLVIALWLAVRRWRHAALLALLSSVAIGAGWAQATRTRNEDYRSETGMWEKTIPLAPQNGYSYTNLGAALYLQGQLDLAREQFIRAAAADPDLASAQSNWGMTLYAEQKYQEAEAHFRRALVIDPHYPQAANNLGAVLAAQGKWAEAQLEYRRALGGFPHYPDAEANLGVADRELGQFAEAETELRQALIDDPDRKGTHLELAVTLHRERKLEAAETQYLIAARDQPADPQIVFNWALLLVSEQKFTVADQRLTAALRLRPDYPEALLNRAMVRSALGHSEAAITDYQAAIRLRPDYADAWADLGAAQLSLQRGVDALTSLRKAADLAPKSAEVRYNLGVALAATGQRDAAITEYLMAVRLKPDLIEARNNLASAYAAEGKLGEAIVQLNEILAKRPGYAHARRNLAMIYRAIGRIPEAEQEEVRASHDEPGSK